MTAQPFSNKNLSVWSSIFLRGLIALIFAFSLVGVQPARPVQAATCTDVSLVTTADTYLSGANTSNNYGAQTYMRVSVPSSSSNYPRGSMLKWDLSSIPSSSTISNASLTLYVSTAGSATFSLYNMRRAWMEGTGTGSATGDGATWQTYDGTNVWGTNGAANISSDRYDTNLWGAGSSTFSATGSTTVSLNTDGIAVVQGWVAGSTSNYGLTIQNYVQASTAVDVQFSTNNNATVANRPTLNVTYCVSTTTPTITTSGTLTPFSSPPGVPSAAQTYTVSGSSLTNDIGISAPAGFQLSKDGGSTYSSSLTLTQSGGSVASTTINVRLNSATEGSFNGNIVHTSSGASEVDIAVSGTVSSCSTVNLTATADTYLSANDVTFNNGGNTELHVDATTDTSRRTTLLEWDLSSIPTSATVSSASLSLYVTDASPLVFNLYNMRRTWVEGTSNRAASTTSANWNTYDGTNSWGTVGAASTSADRYDTNLWSASTTSFSSTGSKTEALNTDGVAVVQGWVSGSTSNYGLTLQNYSGSTSDAVYFSSREATTTANRPILNVTYCASTTLPTITTSGTLTAFTTQPGVPSAAQTYTVSGRNLTGNINISAPSGFQISSDGGSTYNTSLSLTQSGGTVASTTIYVRLNSAAEGSFSGNITHSSTDATTRNVAVSGSVTSASCTDVSLVPSGDTYLSGTNTSNNYGATNQLKVTNYSSYNRTILFIWDLSSIPSTSTISKASLTLNVTQSAAHAYSLYNMRRTWVVGTLDSAASSSSTPGVNWGYSNYQGGTAWGTNGAASTTADRYDTDLWSTDTTTFASTGSKTVSLNANGVAVIQGWVVGSTSNYGLTMQNFASTTSTEYTAIFTSAEGTTTANRPKLNITYCSSSGATHTLTVNSDGNGTVTLNPSGGTYTEGSVVTLTPVPNSGYQFSSWSGTNYDDPTSNNDGTYSLIMDTDKSLTANFSVSTANVAPDQPVLVQPADNATGIATSPSLAVTASDPNASDTLSVSFYGRQVSGTSAGADFTMVVIPDPQNYATSYPDTYTNHLKWIADNKTASNIVFAAAVGDLVNTNTSSTEYTRADTAFDTLDAGSVSYSVGPGNHDMGSGSLWPTYFGTSRFSGKSYYGGAYDDYNHYYLFSASGLDFILINLQYNPTTAIITWANNLLQTNSSRRGIVEQHDILNTDNSWNNQTSYNTLRSNANLFLMLAGHMHTSTDGAAYVAGTGTDGHTIHVVMQDYQDFANSGYLRIYRFSPANSMIYMTTYSPTSGNSITTSPDQMNLAYSMGGGSSGDYSLIGTVTGVTNGSNASISWPSRSTNTEYEWYATVSDGSLTATGSTWNFTTGSGVNSAPVITEGASTSVNMSMNGSPDPFSLTLHATDANSDTLSWSISSAASHGTATASGTGNSKSIGYSPTTNFKGTDSFVVQVSDGNGGTDTITVSVSITGANVAPVITEGASTSVSMSEDGSPTPFNLTLNATDADGDTLNWSVSSAASHGSASASGTGNSKAIGYTPTANYNGTDSFVVQVSDGNGGTDTITVNVTIMAVNDVPVITEGASTSVNMSEDGSPTPFSLTLNATDADGDTLTWSISSAASHGTASASGTGASKAIGYTPNTNYNGTDSFVVRVSDGNGGTDTITVNVTIMAVNDVPVITEGVSTNVSMSEDGSPTAFSLTLDATDADGDTLTWSISSAASHGTASASGTGASKAIGYTPAANYNGSDSFVVRVSDGNGGTDTITINVTIQAVNDAPIANSKSVSVAENTAKSIILSGSDVDSTSLTYIVVSSPSHGVLTDSAPNLTYTPATDYTGPDSFTFKINDGLLDSNTATVTISVTTATPPVVPATFYGEIHINDNPPVAGGTVLAYVQDVVDPVASATIISDSDKLVYSINIPGDDNSGTKVGGVDGDIVTFKIGSRVVATSTWHEGLLIQLNFHPPEANSGGPYNGAAGVALDFTGTANDWGSDGSIYQWDWNYDGSYDETGQNPSHTWADVGTYTIGLKVSDLQGGVGTVIVDVIISALSYSVSLESGWNLVSFNIHPANTSIATVLNSIAGKYDLVYAWNATSGEWMKYNPSLGYGNTLTSLDESMGFWINMNTAATLTVSGSAPGSSNITLKTGWNLVGFPAQASLALPDAFSLTDVGTDFTLVYAYHANDTADPWKKYNISVGYGNDLTQLVPGWGYWVKLGNDHTWVVGY